ncbi:MAG: LysE family translocator [Ahrensia sp.]|nr:LysE family translocator [Ahrensia sp.]
MSEFLPTLPVLATFSLAGLLLAITPGPDMTLFLGRTLAQGRAAGLATLAGTSFGTMIHTVLAVAGISALLAASPTGFWMLKIAGALYLLWLAFQSIVKRSTFALNHDSPATGARPQAEPMRHIIMRNALMGLGVNLLNPKVVIFYMTFLPQFMAADDPNAWKIMLFLGLFYTPLTVPPMVTMILAADRVAHILKSKPIVSRAIDWLFGTVFAVFAIRILMTEGR